MRPNSVNPYYAHSNFLAVQFAPHHIAHEQLAPPAVLETYERFFAFKVENGTVVPKVIARVEHIAANLLTIARNLGTNAQTEQI